MIKEECLAAAANVNPCSTQLKTLRELHNIKQSYESVSDYTKRVKVQWELVKSSVSILYERINQRSYDKYQQKTATEQYVLNAKTDEWFTAYVMIVGADPIRFAEMIERLEHSFSVGNDTYPQTINEAKNILDRTEESNKRSHASKQQEQPLSTEPKQIETKQTEVAHQRASGDDEVELAFTSVRTCGVCGRKGHPTHKCFHRKNIPKEEWHSEKVKALQTEVTEGSPPPEAQFTTTAFYDL
jgi:hypothetical protein